MAGNKTVPTRISASDYLRTVEPKRRKECQQVMRLMRNSTGKRAVMWGASIIGFGKYHYQYASGREGYSMLIGVAPRKQALTIYIMPGFNNYAALLNKLGKFKTAKSCLYINKLADIDLDVLDQLIRRSVQDMRKKYDSC